MNTSHGSLWKCDFRNFAHFTFLNYQQTTGSAESHYAAVTSRTYRFACENGVESGAGFLFFSRRGVLCEMSAVME